VMFRCQYFAMFSATGEAKAGLIVRNTMNFQKITIKQENRMTETNYQEKELHIEQVKNPFEKDILLLLQKKKTCIYGEIIKELRISTAKGQEAIYSLLNKGFIRHKSRSSYLELTVKLNS